MADQLNGKRVAFLFAEGVEQVELTEPLEAVREAGAETTLVSLEKGDVQMFNHLDKGDTIEADLAAGDASADDFDALVLPGGVANPDFLRQDEHAVSFTRGFFEQHKQPDDTGAAQSGEAGSRAGGKPVGVICHGPWTLVEADVVRDRTLTSWPSLRTDLRNAGANWVDEEVHVDRGLVSSRKPDDLPAFCAKLIEEIAEGTHKEQTAGRETAVPGAAATR